jgi:GT2 family glycosyltransferase
MDLTENVTFILHYRKDSPDRERNLHIILHYLRSHLQAQNIIVVHDDAEEDSTLPSLVGPGLVYFPNKGNFKKCGSYNIGAARSKTPLLAFWDVDVLVEPVFVTGSVELLLKREAEHIYPFNGKFINVKSPFIQSFLMGDPQIRNEHKNGNYYATELSSEQSPGGCNLITKDAFERIGRYDERYVGWGFEDTDFFRRSSAKNNVKYIQHPDAVCWHLEHNNTIRTESPDYIQNQQLFFHVNSI